MRTSGFFGGDFCSMCHVVKAPQFAYRNGPLAPEARSGSDQDRSDDGGVFDSISNIEGRNANGHTQASAAAARGFRFGDKQRSLLACLFLFISILADEDLESDQIDAVKAFTQADLDRDLYCNMPEGFSIPGHVLHLHKCLEGVKQGAHLWYKKNKWAMNKCGLISDMAEPNLYIHESLQIIAAVVT